LKIHLSQIPPEGLHLRGEADCPVGDVPDVRCIGPLRYDLNVGISGGALWAQGSLAQAVELQCVSCLEHFAHEIKVPDFALHTELTGPETVDLAPFLREDILLNLPPYPHCDREGENVCAGEKQRTMPEATASREADEKRQHDWGALDQLKVRR
jgi:uncharacterized metal-binding protein YceD (DUF177 family)